MLAFTEWLGPVFEVIAKYGLGVVFPIGLLAMLIYHFKVVADDKKTMGHALEQVTLALGHAARALEDGNAERRKDREWATNEVVKVNREISELKGRMDGSERRR